MKKLSDASNTSCLTLHSLQGAWNVAQTQLADVLRWTSAPRVQARAWLAAVNCSASESSKRLLFVANRK